MSLILVGLIRCYQRWFQPATGCIFDPVCSEYYVEAIRARGAYEGFILGSERLARCTTTTLEAHRVTAAHRSCPADGCSIPDRVAQQPPERRVFRAVSKDTRWNRPEPPTRLVPAPPTTPAPAPVPQK